MLCNCDHKQDKAVLPHRLYPALHWGSSQGSNSRKRNAGTQLRKETVKASVLAAYGVFHVQAPVTAANSGSTESNRSSPLLTARMQNSAATLEEFGGFL